MPTDNKQKTKIYKDKKEFDKANQAYNDSTAAYKRGERNMFNEFKDPEYNVLAFKKIKYSPYKDVNIDIKGNNLSPISYEDNNEHFYKTKEEAYPGKIKPIGFNLYKSTKDWKGNLVNGNDIIYSSVYQKPTTKPVYQPEITNSVPPIVKPKPNLVKAKPKLVLEPIKPLGIKPMETYVEAKLAGNVEVPAMSTTKGATQNYTAAEALKLQGKPSGYINEGDNTGRQEFRNGGWLDGLEGDKTTQAPDVTNATEYVKNGGWLNNLPNNKFDMGGVLDGLDGVDKGTQVPDATATAKPVVNLNFAVTPAQKQLLAKNKRQRELDENPSTFNVMKDYVGMGIKEPGLQTPAVDPIDLVGTGAYKGLAKALGAKEVAVAADAALFNSLDKSKVLYNQVKSKAKDEIYKLKYKKDIASLESKKFNAMQKMNNPEGWKRLREQGIEPKQFFDQLNKSKITSTRNTGSWDNGAQINIDFDQVKKLQKEGYDLSVDNIIDHEIGHRMQRGFNSKAVKDYNQAKSYNYKIKVPEYHVYSTPLDKDAELLLSPVIKNPNENSNYFLFGSDNKERLPFLREAKESMVSKGFINNIYSKITPETVKKFLKEVPSNRFSTFLDVENPITHRRLSGLLNKTPIMAGAGLGVNELAKDKKQNGGWLDNLK